jgi:hypothetical protein
MDLGLLPSIIPAWVWIKPSHHNQEENYGKECIHVKYCPYQFTDGKRCNRPGCLGYWKDMERSHGDVVYIKFRVLHSHYIVDSYAQGRNTSHIMKHMGRLATDDECIWVKKLRNNLKIPQHILDDFNRLWP